MQMAFYFDQTRCSSCYTCIVACKDWHDVPAGTASWMRVTTLEKGRFPDVFVAHLINPCYHCVEPACQQACPAGAISKHSDSGIVVVDRDLCVGHDKCDMCLQACPYDSPQFGSEANAKMQKCDFCVDRLAVDKPPICVGACPMRAIDAGPIEEMRAKYGDVRVAEGFKYDAKVKPAVIFKQKRGARDLETRSVYVAPVTAGRFDTKSS